MKLTSSKPAHRGLTLMEVLLVLIMITLVASLIPASYRSGPSRRIACLSNLKAMGLGFRLGANDHGDQFPWNVPPPKGAQGLTLPDIYRFCSNEFNTPKILTCPADTARQPVRDWVQFSTNHLSYFIGLDADESKWQTILTGDRQLAGGVWTTNRVMLFTTNAQPAWRPAIHGVGNLGLADGSAFQTTPQNLREAVAAACALLPAGQPLRLLMP